MTNTLPLPAEVEERFYELFYKEWIGGSHAYQYTVGDIKAFLAEEIERAKAECSAEWEEIAQELWEESPCAGLSKLIRLAEQKNLLTKKEK